MTSSLFQCGCWFQPLISTCECQTQTRGKNEVYKTKKNYVQKLKKYKTKTIDGQNLKDADITEIKIQILVKKKKNMCICKIL